MKNNIPFNIVSSLFYSFLYYYIYVNYLNLDWEYFGYYIYDRAGYIWGITFIISVFPIVLYRGYYNISSFIAIIIYLFLYVPTIITFTFAAKNEIQTIWIVQLAYMFGMSLFFYADRRSINLTKFIRRVHLPMKYFLITTSLLSLYILWLYRNSLDLVSFSEVYNHRRDNSEVLASHLISGYIFAWLGVFFGPICLAYGLTFKKAIYFLAGTFSSVLVYAASAAKGTLLLPIVFIGFYFLLKHFGIGRISNTLVLIISFFSVLIILFLPSRNEVVLWAATIFFMRTLSIGGLLNVMYFNFFSSHPYTYFSHVNIINFFTGIYPYGNKGLGQVVGSYFLSDDLNANANFWATDGIASLGVVGILLISILVYYFLVLINGVSKGLNIVFVSLVFIPLIGSLLNTSFFSTLLTGGGFLLIFSLMFIEKSQLNT